jgi:hypothetical protein
MLVRRVLFAADTNARELILTLCVIHIRAQNYDLSALDEME